MTLHLGKEKLEHILKCKICLYRIQETLASKNISKVIRESKKIIDKTRYTYVSHHEKRLIAADEQKVNL